MGTLRESFQTDLDGWCVAPIGEADRDDLRELFVGCDDYVFLTEGRHADSAQVEELLQELPPGKTKADKHLLGIRQGRGSLVGVLDIVLGYPARNDWYLGLLLLLPAVRGQGLGERVYRAVEDWARRQGSEAIFVTVFEQNLGALRFWQKMGFTAVSSRRVRMGELENVAIRMMRRLRSPAASTQ